MNDAQILEALKEATRGLTFMSESDYPVEVFDWGKAEPTPEFLRGLDGSVADAPVETRTAAEFFRAATSEPDWKGADELAVAKRFQALLRLLEENLSDLKVFRVGTINIPVYVAGRSASGSWLGVSTRVVET
ncbi:MAG TPA: nuclease A inhibitor family protein [Pyrinomonadaceae bacterium]